MERKKRKNKLFASMEAGNELGFFRSIEELKQLGAIGKKKNKKEKSNKKEEKK
ncbi:hypothetical protein ACFPTR_04060 [Aliibacillus thermotolerans]|uniref:YfhE family protein n=1 Tax=Aliibacillus thermotolerans TaxID=1834418 RepID=A0ABW0U5M6_9BACI|nr:hypothetical protein [Aliibacillus thermotolerans]MDA3130629.1 hypothetical protein [Aliibacillus thermotolerans]